MEATISDKLKQPYRDLLPPLSTEEFEALKADIKANGVLAPILVDEDGNILDGHHRYKIDKDAPRKVIRGLSEDEKQAMVIRSNLTRRNLSPEQKREVAKQQREIAKRLRELDAKKWTQKRLAELLGIGQQTVSDWFSNNTESGISSKPDARVKLSEDAKRVVAERIEAGETQAQVAADFGVSQKTASNVLKEAERKKDIERQRQEIAASPPETPSGLFSVISMDPPWPYGREYDPEGSRVANPYPEMSLEQIRAISLPATDDCVLFLWTTHQFIPHCYQMLEDWGFAYKATMVWDKERIGMGAWLRMQCEFCLVGVKGKPNWENTKHRDIIREARREHSRKPESFYAVVEEITTGNRLDYFSREPRKGWQSFGNDTSKF